MGSEHFATRPRKQPIQGPLAVVGHMEHAVGVGLRGLGLRGLGGRVRVEMRDQSRGSARHAGGLKGERASLTFHKAKKISTVEGEELGLDGGRLSKPRRRR